ncbi:MAG: HD domain-containing protein [Treponema sp.]|jgi:HD superfamily phosphohydrolase|nr:HD domain-containing protein [Treponema sp.]
MGISIQAVLSEGFNCPVRDVLWGHIYFTPELAALTNAAPFTRLHRILQLGPVYHVYPGATHTRASHSMGVYHLGRRLLQNLAERGEDGSVSPALISREGALSFLCASLLHDLGHFPYTHSLKELPLRSHESLTGSIILAEPVKSLVARCGADPEFTAAIIDKDLSAQERTDELFFYRRLLSGCFDPDKLDYLNRDARYCGVPYGVQDVDFILSRLIPCPKRGVDIDSRLIPNVEAILFAKYLMYRTVYWHRQVRAATSMIKKALLGGLESGKIAAEELYNLDDQGLFALLREKMGSPSDSLAEAVWNGNFYSVAAEIPFIEADHACLRDIKQRSHHEKLLAEEIRRRGVPLGSDDLIIDVPEPASFETGLFVSDENCRFTESSSAFKAEILDSFVNTLYTIRIFVSPYFCKKIETISNLSAILINESLRF